MDKEKLQNWILDTLEKHFEISIDVEVERPKDTSNGDYSSNIALKLSAKLGENPKDIANQIKSMLEESNISEIKKIEVAGPGFINFYLNKKNKLQILSDIIKPDFLLDSTNSEKNIIIEFSSPNIAKPFTIGHLRSTIIGESISRIYEALGFKVFRDNHLGDWGASFGKYLAAFESYKIDLNSLLKSETPIKDLVDIYIKFNTDSEENEELIDEARNWFKKLEEGDSKAREYWEKCIEISLKEFKRLYEILDVSFTENEGKGYGESYFEEEMQHVLSDLESAAEKGTLEYKESDGARLVFFDKSTKLPPLMILKSNGTTLYSTRDLATDRFRMNRDKYGYPDLTIVNEVGGEQKLYWRQIFKIEELLGWYKPGQRVHVSHGHYRFKEGKMSTRKGNVIWLEDILEKAIDKAKQVAKDNSKDLDIEEVSKVVGIGAIKWNDLKRDSNHDITFDWDEILNIKGNSGPYVQYTYARTNSILTEAGDFDHTLNYEVLNSSEEVEIINHLVKYKEIIERSAEEYAPHMVCTYLYDLSQLFNSFYNKHSVLNAKSEVDKNARLVLTNAVRKVLREGLELLGINVLDRM